jgi:ubiquinone/menaquinone biosynthesis C-methylase UbiE
MSIQELSPATFDLAAIKSRQQRTWASGDYALIGTTLQIVGELLCEAVDLRSNQRVLDVAAGNGNATLAAARRFADVTSTDYVAALLERGRERAQAERLAVTFREADAEALPFPQESFDVVLSTFGVMFAPNQPQAASELIRVCRRGGKIGLTNWAPRGFIGQLFKTIGKHLPPPLGVQSPALWGSALHLEKLFGTSGSVVAQSRSFIFRYRSEKHWLEVFRGYYGPVLKAFEALGPAEGASLEADIIDLLKKFNVADDGTLVIPSEYLEVIVTRNR